MQAIDVSTGKANGKRGRPVPEPAARKPAAALKPAHDEKARLAKLRSANNGFIVPRPPEHLFAAAGPALANIEQGSGLSTANAAMHTILDWLQQIHAAGGTADDVRLAWDSWQHCRPGAKLFARNRFDELVQQATLRDIERGRAIEAERANRVAINNLRNFVTAARQREEQQREAYAMAKLETAKWQTALASALAAEGE